MLRQYVKSILVAASVLLAISSCSGHYRIDGIVETIGYEGRQLYLTELLPWKTTRLDSCKVENGRFRMKGCVDSIKLVFLCKDEYPIVPVYMERGHATIRLTPTGNTVSGTRQNDLFFSFLRDKTACDNRYEEVSQKRFSREIQSDAVSLQMIQDSLLSIVGDCEEMICKFMSRNYDEPAAVGVFMMLSVAPTTEIPSLLKRILDAAPQEFLGNSYVKGYTERMNYARKDQ